MDISIKEFHRRIKEFPFIKKESTYLFEHEMYPLNLFIGKYDNFTKNTPIFKYTSFGKCLKKGVDMFGRKMTTIGTLRDKNERSELYCIPVELFYSPYCVRHTLSRFKAVNLEIACKYPQFFFLPIYFTLRYPTPSDNKPRFGTFFLSTEHFFHDDFQRLMSYICGYSDFKPDFSDSVINIERPKVKLADVKASLFK
ncbi:MAG: hypothetical protein LBC33_02335 [Mycoplasmataceae bacterium]|jgi:hypothetical protein|nr:hypothetical protein [Mycoplasmataceae bacterium]